MRVVFRISLDEFRTLQPEQTVRAARRAPWKTAYAIALIAILFCLLVVVPSPAVLKQDLSRLPVSATDGLLLSLLACAASLAATHLLDRRFLARARRHHETSLRAGYERIHCRDSRAVEACDDGLILSCRCETLLKPWHELTGFTETPVFLIALAGGDCIPIPKAAFATEGALTEFRRMILDKLHTDRPSTAYPIEFTHRRSDFWRAKLLHTFRGGGWRRSLKILLASCVFLSIIAASFNWARGGRAPAFVTVVAIGAFIFFLSRVVRLGNYYMGPLWICFSEAGLHVADPASQSRRRWSELAGYLEGGHVYLLYLNPRLYRVIPKRALGHRDDEFRRLLENSVPLFDYRRAAPLADAAQV